MFETDRAIDELTTVLRAPDAAMPYGARARAERLLGTAHDRLGHHDLALRAYAAALADAPKDDALHTREQVRAAERQTIDPRAAESYRLSLEGWRAFQRGAKDEAATALQQALELTPEDMVARYRYARLLASRGDAAAERDNLERIIAARPPAPAIVLASAFDDYAHLLERDGDLARALTMYRYAIEVVGGDPRAHSDAQRSAKRLAGSVPHRNF